MADNVYFVGPLERVVYLRTVPASESLGFEELVSIAQRARERFFPKGSFLIQRGQDAAAFHLVVEGQVQVWREGLPSETIGPQEVVGFLHLLARADERLEARAETDVLTLEFDSDAQMDLCEEHFGILLNYASFLCGALKRERIKHPGLGGCPSAPAAPSPTRNGPALVDRVLAFFESPAFCNCSVDGLGELARHVSDAPFNSGDQIWKKGERAGHFLLIVSGKVECSVDGRRFGVDSGGLAGMEEALSGEPRWHEARAASPVEALRIDVEPFLDILEDHFEMAMQFLSSIALRVIELQELNAAD